MPLGLTTQCISCGVRLAYITITINARTTNVVKKKLCIAMPSTASASATAPGSTYQYGMSSGVRYSGADHWSRTFLFGAGAVIGILRPSSSSYAEDGGVCDAVSELRRSMMRLRAIDRDYHLWTTFSRKNAFWGIIDSIYYVR